MDNENDQTNSEETQEEESQDETQEESGDVNWEARAKELEVKATKQREKTKELKSKLKEFEDGKGKPEKPNKPNEDFSTGDIALMEQRGHKSTEEQDYVKEAMDKYSLSLKEVLGDDYHQAKMKGIKEAIAVKDATPSGSKRTPASGKASVEYWLAKGGLPPESDKQLRRDVLNARIKQEERGSKFAPQSVIAQLPPQ